ncbi:hypothetical protein NSP_8350 [Nodularia spumigena CCY9414]|nr:hypothetical protein NSP_8350 [Nodularia spumigena CCY9414]
MAFASPIIIYVLGFRLKLLKEKLDIFWLVFPVPEFLLRVGT